MRTFAENLLALPMPVLAVLTMGLICRRWQRLSRVLFATGTIALFLFSLPIIGQLLLWPLSRPDTPPNAIADAKPAAIVVPTAGIYEDGTGNWWPSSSSVRRVVLGLQVQDRHSLPLILTGGSPVAGRPAEARVIGRHFNLSERTIIIDDTARNSFETGHAVAKLVQRMSSSRVVLITSDAHAARMSASLRHAGLEVLGISVRSPGSKFQGWTDFLPSPRGLAISTAVVKEYCAVLWYLVARRFDLADLFSSDFLHEAT